MSRCFRCSVGDGVEHYAVCPIVRNFFRNKLDPLAGLHDLLLLSRQPVSVQARHALGVYAFVHAVNAARHQHLSAERAGEALQQGLREAARGCPTALQLFYVSQ